MRFPIYIAAAAILMVGALASASAGAQQRENACMSQCRTDLERRELLSAYPAGYCRKKCNYGAVTEIGPARTQK